MIIMCMLSYRKITRTPLKKSKQTLWLYSLHATVRHLLWGSHIQGKDLTKVSVY